MGRYMLELLVSARLGYDLYLGLRQGLLCDMKRPGPEADSGGVDIFDLSSPIYDPVTSENLFKGHESDTAVEN
jgi:hypothetical protein